MNIELSKTNLSYLKHFYDGACAYLCVDTCNQFGTISMKKKGVPIEEKLKVGLLGQLKAKGLLNVSTAMIYGVNYHVFKLSEQGKQLFEGGAYESK